MFKALSYDQHNSCHHSTVNHLAQTSVHHSHHKYFLYIKHASSLSTSYHCLYTTEFFTIHIYTVNMSLHSSSQYINSSNYPRAVIIWSTITVHIVYRVASSTYCICLTQNCRFQGYPYYLPFSELSVGVQRSYHVIEHGDVSTIQSRFISGKYHQPHHRHLCITYMFHHLISTKFTT